MDPQDPSLAALVPALTAHLPELLDEVRAALAEDWPEYARFLEENQAQVGFAAEAAVRSLVTIAAAEPAVAASQGQHDELFEEIGRIQWRQGRDLTALLSAYQVGARVFWHSVSATAVDLSVEPRTLAALAEAVFVFVDKLSSSSARGYVLEQSEAVATRERLRDELVTLLLSDRADVAAVRAAARRAGWPLPDSVAVVLIQPDNPTAQTALRRMDPSNLLFSRPPLVGALVPNPARPGLRKRLAHALRGTRAVVGMSVPPDRLPASLHVAEIAARLQQTNVLTDDPAFTDEHLDAIIVHRDSRLLEALREQVLRPLAAVSPASRERLLETLTAWLRHMGDRQTVAAELHVHPQTVRYRLARLHELFGPELDDPDARARLALALSWGFPQPTEPAPAAEGDEPAAPRPARQSRRATSSPPSRTSGQGSEARRDVRRDSRGDARGEGRGDGRGDPRAPAGATGRNPAPGRPPATVDH